MSPTITTVPHEIHSTTGPYTVQAEQLPCGLYVYEIPADVDRGERCRWRIGHHSGRYIASTRERAAALQLAADIADWANWTLGADILRAHNIGPGRDQARIDDFLARISQAGGHLGTCSDYGPYGC
ncbi:hypothetical protein AB0O91_21870 [Kitasatospora sp. NPDC089797]|uniref:hypothetical protein n=1 Tax=Kitasatospora sp. NPDC089797 TaxID=3155298 RepID=UPI0034482986